MIGSRPAALRARVKCVHGMGHQNADAKKNESPCNRRAHATPPIRLDELNGRRPCTLKVIREDNAGCGLSDEIEPQRLGGNIRNGADLAKRVSRTGPVSGDERLFQSAVASSHYGPVSGKATFPPRRSRL
jgi:hypothetical protein